MPSKQLQEQDLPAFLVEDRTRLNTDTCKVFTVSVFKIFVWYRLYELSDFRVNVGETVLEQTTHVFRGKFV